MCIRDRSNNELKKFVVGIDLGTTNSLIASYDDNLKIYDDDSSSLIPSVVSINDSGLISVGSKAVTNPDNVKIKNIISIKRIMGLSYSDLSKINFVNDLDIVCGKNKNEILCNCQVPRNQEIWNKLKTINN